MALKKLIIWGASGHALVVANIIQLRKEYKIIGYLDDVNICRKGSTFGGSVVLGGREQLSGLYKQGVRSMILGFGDCSAKLIISDFVKSNGFQLITAIHPDSSVSNDAEIGDGTVIAAGVVIDPAVKLGENVIINKGALVGHESIIGDAAHIAPGVNIAGGVKVGKSTFIGIGSSIIPRVKIGSNSIVGAGSVVLKDIPDEVVVYGVPAKIIKKVK